MLPTPVPADTPDSEAVDLPASSPLQACPHCNALIDTTAREPLERIACPGCAAPIAMSGSIAGFELVEIAGRGGQGVVYKAYDPSLDRHIAIKLLRKDHSNDRKLIAQLEAEASITASINDPNVVRVYACGFDRARFFLAMELVDKGSLDDLIRIQGRVAEVQVLEVAIQIATGLRAALQHGLIHRDVKPGNILFADAHTSKIVDFGLAQFLHQAGESTGEIWGTPYYVPPEKLEGEPEDFRSDMYSLGATLFHALAGRPPFEAESASLVAMKHLKSQAVSLQSFAPWVSNPTAHIVNRTLSKNPADRFQSYDDLINNLHYALEQLQTQGAAVKARSRVILETEDDQKTWTWVVLGMAAVIVALIGVFIFARPRHPGDASPKAGTTTTPAAKYPLEGEVRALVEGDPKASALLEAASARGSLTTADRAWAQLLTGAAHLVANRDAEARTAFGKVSTMTKAVKDPSLAAFLGEISGQLKGTSPITAGEMLRYRKDNHEAAAFLLAGLHDWQVGALEDGANLLKQFRNTSPADNVAWLGELKPLINAPLEQLLGFQMAVERLKAATSATDRSNAITNLRKFTPAFGNRVEATIAPFAQGQADYEKSLFALPEPGLYKIINKHSGLALDVTDHKLHRGTAVRQWGYGGGVNQTWEITPAGGDAYRIRAAHSRKLLSVKDSTNAPGAPVCQWDDDGTPANLWKLEPKGNRMFFIRCTASNQVLGVDHMSKESGASVVQWNKPGTDDHFWRIERVGDRLGDWCASDLGAAKTPGQTKLEGGAITFEVNNENIWGTSDSCRLAYREVTGDFDFVVHVASAQSTSPNAKMGIMLRHSLNPQTKNLLFGFAAHGLIQQHRQTDNGETVQIRVNDEVKVPGWLKLSRRGDKLMTFQSVDGRTWTEFASEETKIRREAVIGLATSSWGSSNRLKVTFDQISLTQP